MIPKKDSLICFLVQNLLSSNWNGSFIPIMKNEGWILESTMVALE